MKATFTPGPWMWADVRGAGLQIRGPYQDSTRLMFSDIWRGLPEPEWDATMIANTRLAAAAPELLEALRSSITGLEVLEVALDVLPAGLLPGLHVLIQDARAAIAKATGGAA